jgi:hypothetical protein
MRRASRVLLACVQVDAGEVRRLGLSERYLTDLPIPAPILQQLAAKWYTENTGERGARECLAPGAWQAALPTRAAPCASSSGVAVSAIFEHVYCT